MFLIGAINPIIEKNLELVLVFTRLFRGGEWSGYKIIKLVLFLYAVGLLAAKKNIAQKKGEKRLVYVHFSI